MQVIKKRNAVIPLDKDNNSGIIDYKSYYDDVADYLQRRVTTTLYSNQNIKAAPINPTNATLIQSSQVDTSSDSNVFIYHNVMNMVAPMTGMYNICILMNLFSGHLMFDEFKLDKWECYVSIAGVVMVRCYQDWYSSTIYNTDCVLIPKGTSVIARFEYAGKEKNGFELNKFLWTPEQLLNGYAISHEHSNFSRCRFNITYWTQPL